MQGAIYDPEGKLIRCIGCKMCDARQGGDEL